MRQHHLEGQQRSAQLFEQGRLLAAPLVQAAAPELAFLVPQEGQLLGRRHELLPVNVVEPEAGAFDLVFDVAPEDGVHALQCLGEQAELEFGVEIFGDDLRIVVDFKDDGPAVPDDGHAVIALPGQSPDQGAVGRGNVGDFEGGAGKFQNAALDDAERTPRKLNQFNHLFGLNHANKLEARASGGKKSLEAP